MKILKLAHVSDLHFGRDAEGNRANEALAAALVLANVDHVVVTGDVTHRGRCAELAAFHRAFAWLLEREKVTVVPGNHDRLNDDVADEMTRGVRVRSVTREGLHLVCLDSTAPHNRSFVSGHGLIGPDEIEAVARAMTRAPRSALVCLALHHHPAPLPGDGLFESFLGLLGQPWIAELAAGMMLLESIQGRCDLVLHGHRHVPAEISVAAVGGRPLTVYNAGASGRLGRARVFRHRDGRLVAAPEWLEVVARDAERCAASPWWRLGWRRAPDEAA